MAVARELRVVVEVAWALLPALRFVAMGYRQNKSGDYRSRNNPRISLISQLLDQRQAFLQTFLQGFLQAFLTTGLQTGLQLTPQAVTNVWPG